MDNNYKLWLENDGKVLKQAIRATGKNVNESLERLLQDQYIKEETAVIEADTSQLLAAES